MRGSGAFLRSMRILRERIFDDQVYPFSIPAIRRLDEFEFHPRVTYLVGENGTGKSTLIEAIALALGFNAEGGSRNFQFVTRRSVSSLHMYLQLVRGIQRPRTGYFLRAESFYNVATEIERLDSEPAGARRLIDGYGGKYLHELSHGESFQALLKHRFRPHGLYVLDEPEAALSPRRQLDLIRRIHRLVQGNGAQFIIATHSPIVLAYPDAEIHQLDGNGIQRTKYEDTDMVRFSTTFMRERESILDEVMSSATQD